MLTVAIVAMISLGVSLMASGRSSLNDIHNMAPAANHNPQGRSGWNADTNKNAGTATSGWGSEEKIDRRTAFHGLTHLGTMTDQIASHSGMFWIAITSATSNHNFQLGPKANHMAIPSVPECTVIIARNIMSCHAVLPVVLPKVRCFSCWWTKCLAHITIPIPTRIPQTTHHRP